MKVYLVRHGESVGNKNGIFQTSEMGLSDTGIRQAKLVAERLKNHKIDLIYSSTYKRARQTADIIAKTTGAPIEYWDDLAELRNPSEIQGKSINDPKAAKIRGIIQKNFTNPNWKYSDEETFTELNKRANKVIEHILQKHGNENIVCVSHGSIIKAIISRMVFGGKLTAGVFKAIRYGFWSINTGISVCEYRTGRGWGITSWNDTSHL